jgi:hypothetical protein
MNESMFDEESVNLAVFSHPNHEIAVYATLRRVKAHTVFLTDGGGMSRVRETLLGLGRIDLLDRAIFLGYPEQAFYRALIEKDSEFFAVVARSLRSVCRQVRPHQVICDAVEFYNPVHDMTAPVVRLALSREDDRIRLYEAPLVYEAPGQPDAYRLQDVPSSSPAHPFRVVLPTTTEERLLKAEAISHCYGILKRTMGPLIDMSPHAYAREVLVPSHNRTWEAFQEGYGLRYDRRADELLRKGEIQEAIHYGDQWQATTRALAGASL